MPLRARRVAEQPPVKPPPTQKPRAETVVGRLLREAVHLDDDAAAYE